MVGICLFDTYFSPLSQSPKRRSEKTSKPCGFEWSERGPNHQELSLGPYLILVETKELAASWQLPENYHQQLGFRAATAYRTVWPWPHTVPLETTTKNTGYHYSQWLPYITKPSRMVRNIITYYKPTHPQLSSGTGHLWGLKKRRGSQQNWLTASHNKVGEMNWHNWQWK